jgi:hypothetical protein
MAIRINVVACIVSLIRRLRNRTIRVKHRVFGNPVKGVVSVSVSNATELERYSGVETKTLIETGGHTKLIPLHLA